MTWTYDPEADAAYLSLGPGPVLESEEVRPSVVLDFDASGKIVGIEVLSAKAMLPADLLVAPLAAE